MLTMLVLGAALVVLGIAGSANACMSEDRNLTMALIAGLSLAIGCVLLAVGAVRRGYHYRPEGAPPGDMDPAKSELPAPDNPPTR
ncbi:MAG TPA: hypothetical protein VL263_21945 [Vicinamibacterales bacterium]|jgi:hypothetical protein|nr:hypothetical protein [Vicinamibacterales bacterium]